MILLDSSVLIELFRAPDKQGTLFSKLLANDDDFAISIITHYEVFIGSTESQYPFWKELLETIAVFDFDLQCSEHAVKIYKDLKKKNKLIDLADILIAATCLSNNIPIATLNVKHFERIKELKIING
jgi:tRNA(fMet)-specific endonuclease VapC